MKRERQIPKSVEWWTVEKDLQKDGKQIVDELEWNSWDSSRCHNEEWGYVDGNSKS